MSGRHEQKAALQTAALRELAQGRIDRREFMTRSLVAGLGAAGVGVVAKSGIGPAFAADRPLTPTFYQWIQDLHPGIMAVNAKFPGINYQIAPVEGFGIERFVAEAKNGQSSWDVYVGQTPFVEMSAFIKAGVIEPWDNYIPKRRYRRHSAVDPSGEHRRRQALWLAVPAGRDRIRLALGHHDEGWLARLSAGHLGRFPRWRQDDRRLKERSVGRHIR